MPLTVFDPKTGKLVTITVPGPGDPPARRLGDRARTLSEEKIFQAQFMKFRQEDNRPIPVASPIQVVGPKPDQAMERLKRLVDAGRWPAFADAVCLFADGIQIDSFIPAPGDASEPQGQ
jgi:hypothetical protein